MNSIGEGEGVIFVGEVATYFEGGPWVIWGFLLFVGKSMGILGASGVLLMVRETRVSEVEKMSRFLFTIEVQGF